MLIGIGNVVENYKKWRNITKGGSYRSVTLTQLCAAEVFHYILGWIWGVRDFFLPPYSGLTQCKTLCIVYGYG